MFCTSMWLPRPLLRRLGLTQVSGSASLYFYPSLWSSKKKNPSRYIFICQPFHAKAQSVVLLKQKKALQHNDMFNLAVQSVRCKLVTSVLKAPAFSLLWPMGWRSGLWMQNFTAPQCSQRKDQLFISSQILVHHNDRQLQFKKKKILQRWKMYG